MSRPEIIIFLEITAARLLFHILTRFTFDDAFITFRYAENLVAGNGFVFNVGERVLGTTTPLFTMILAAFGSLGLSIPMTALILSLLASGLTAIVLYRMAGGVGFGRLASVPVIVYALFPRLLPTDTGGMETALFTMLVTLAFYLNHQRKHMSAITIAALATLVRPEGLMVVGLLMIYVILKQPRQIVQALLIVALLILPWVVFASIYFGSPIPHSISAKLALYSHVWASSASDSFIFVMGWHNPFGWVLTALAAVGGYRLIRERRFGRLELIWMVVTIVALTFSSTLVFRWYIAPIYPIYILFASASILVLAERIRRLIEATPTLRRLSQKVLFPIRVGWGLVSHHPDGGHKARRYARLRMIENDRQKAMSDEIELMRKPLRYVLGLGLIVLLIAANYPTVKNYHLEADVLTTIHEGVVGYIQAHAAEDDVVSTENLGYVGYHLDQTILDRVGLVSPVAVDYNRRGDCMELIIDSQPEWLVISPDDPTATFLDSAAFTTAYELRETFASPLLDAWAFDVYRRVE